MTGLHGCREYVPNAVDLKLFWFGPGGGVSAGGEQKTHGMGGPDLDKVLLM